MSSSYLAVQQELVRQLERMLGREEARAEACAWFEEGLGKGRTWLAAHGASIMDPSDAIRIEQWMQRRQAGVPWQQILGWTTFRGRRYAVTEDVLIPRPETELVVEAALVLGREIEADRVVDVGVGSGIIAISLALETPWVVSATDISPAALSVARHNAETHGVAISFHQGNLLEAVPDPLELVVANLPYVDPLERPCLQPELAHEPAIALFGGPGGTQVIRQLLEVARARQARACVLEVGAGQGTGLLEFVGERGWGRAWIKKDLAGHDRVLTVEA